MSETTAPVARVEALIARSAVGPAVTIAYDIVADGHEARVAAQGHADTIGAPVAVYAMPYGTPFGGSARVWDLPFVGTFQPRVTGPCSDGRTNGGVESDACTHRATTTVPSSVWAPGSSTEYPANVPACERHAADVWAAEDRASQRAEERATVSDALS